MSDQPSSNPAQSTSTQSSGTQANQSQSNAVQFNAVQSNAAQSNASQSNAGLTAPTWSFPPRPQSGQFRPLQHGPSPSDRTPGQLVDVDEPVLIEFVPSTSVNEHGEYWTAVDAPPFISHGQRVWSLDGQPIRLAAWNTDLLVWGVMPTDPDYLRLLRRYEAKWGSRRELSNITVPQGGW